MDAFNTSMLKEGRYVYDIVITNSLVVQSVEWLKDKLLLHLELPDGRGISSRHVL